MYNLDLVDGLIDGKYDTLQDLLHSKDVETKN